MNRTEKQPLERILELAVVVSWKDLMRGAESGLIHIEYDLAPSGTLDCLRIWSLITRGHWLLACEYWMSPSTFHGTGIHFENGYQSEGLAQILDSVMQHQNSFLLPPNRARPGLLQIPTPKEADRAAATAVSEAIDCFNSALAEPALA